MSRDLEALVAAEFAKQQLRPVRFVEFKIAAAGSPAVDQYARFWNGPGEFVWDSKTWTGTGIFGSISNITETRDVIAQGIEIALSGIPPTLIQTVLDDVRVGFPVRVWTGTLDASEAVIPEPYESFSGRVDAVDMVMDGQSGTVSIKCESDLIRLQIPNESRMTHADQQIEFPGDLGFEFVEGLQDVQLSWGQPTASAAPNSGGAAGPTPAERLTSSFIP